MGELISPFNLPDETKFKNLGDIVQDPEAVRHALIFLRSTEGKGGQERRWYDVFLTGGLHTYFGKGVPKDGIERGTRLEGVRVFNGYIGDNMAFLHPPDNYFFDKKKGLFLPFEDPKVKREYITLQLLVSTFRMIDPDSPGYGL